MATDDSQSERFSDGQDAGAASGTPSDAVVDYELTAKDAGWRTPTFLIAPAKLVIFDPPRPKRSSSAEGAS